MVYWYSMFIPSTEIDYNGLLGVGEQQGHHLTLLLLLCKHFE